MQILRQKWYVIILLFLVHSLNAATFSSDSVTASKKAFVFKPDEFAVGNIIKICSNAHLLPVGYESEINMPVCDDKLCANVFLKIKWDLAGNFLRFDTLAGKPLTKFDHKRFVDADYIKLGQILNDRNSILRLLEKDELIDKSIKLKATTVDAVTGATPATIKNAVVEGAVYSTYVLWHFVNGSVRDSIRTFTLRNYSESISDQMLLSHNYETQLFALKRMIPNDYELHSEIIFRAMRQGSPLIRAYIINKFQLPFQDKLKNQELVSIFPELDGYSRSVLLDRITASKEIVAIFLPLMTPYLTLLDQKQTNKLKAASQTYSK